MIYEDEFIRIKIMKGGVIRYREWKGRTTAKIYYNEWKGWTTTETWIKKKKHFMTDNNDLIGYQIFDPDF